MYYRIYQTKCKVYITKNNKYITLCEKDYYVYYVWIIMFGLLCLDVKKNVRNKSHCIDVLFMEHIV